MKKKVVALVLSVVMCFAITACGDKETGTTNVESANDVQESVNDVQESVAEPSSEAQESAEEPSSEETVSTEEAEETNADAAGAEENADVEIKVEIPDGFSEVTDGMYMAEDGANIIVLTTAATGEIPSEEAITEQLKSTLGDTEITVEEYEVYKVGDYDALRFTANYVQEDIECTQTQCMVFADGKIGMAAFTQQTGGAWTDAFEKCIEGITME